MFTGKKPKHWDRLSETQKCWVWAAFEQEHLHYSHDAAWEKAAAMDWQDSDALFDMISSYQVRRGKFSNFVTKKVKQKKKVGKKEKEIETATPDRAGLKLFANAVVWAGAKLKNTNFSGAEIDHVVHTGVNRLKERTSKRTKPSGAPLSAFTKAMWFAFPDQMTMYDSRAIDGLRMWFSDKKPKVKVRPETFFERFEEFYNVENQKNAQDAIRWWGWAYPHPRRVADKFLWLYANPKRRKILAHFHPSHLPPVKN